MATQLSIDLDEDVAWRVQMVKDHLGLSWGEFMARAADELVDKGPEIEVPSIEDEAPGFRTHLEQAEMARERGENYDWREVNKRADAWVNEAPAPVNDAIRELDLPGSGEALDDRRMAVQILYDCLRERESMHRRELLDSVDTKLAGYDTAEAFWNECLDSGAVLQSLPGVVGPGEGEQLWRYTEP